MILKKTINFLLVGVAVLVFILWIRPLMADVDALKSYKQVLEDTLSKTRELQILRDNLLTQYNSFLAKDMEKLSKVIPDKDEATKLMVEFSNIASDQGVIIRAFDTQTNKPDSNLGTLPPSGYYTIIFNTEVLGSYGGFRSFIEELQRSARLIDIDSISFSSKEYDVYEFNVNGKAYFK